MFKDFYQQCLAVTGFATLTVLLYLGNEWLMPILQFDRLAIFQGQWWRLFSGHLLHTNQWHLLMNLAGFTVIYLLHSAYYSSKNFLFLMLAGFLLIGIALLLWSPAISQYVGLSGWLHCLLVWGACRDIQRNWSSGWLILVGTFGKVIWEQLQGADPQLVTLIDANVAIDAHLYGAISGGIIFILTLVYHQFSQRKAPLHDPTSDA